jgi:hypothetical protein
MKNHMMSGFWRFMFKVPPALWEKEIEKHRRRVLSDSAFMTPEHRRVHHFAVSALPGRSEPLTPDEIALSLGFEKGRVIEILRDLEEHMTFLFRNDSGAVIWAYPMTVEETPHHLTFDDGRTCHAA